MVRCMMFKAYVPHRYLTLASKKSVLGEPRMVL
jgi:hypothetical protein